jgi:hypothetical protein
MHTDNDVLATLEHTAPRWGWWSSLGGLTVSMTWGFGMLAMGDPSSPRHNLQEHPIVYRVTVGACFFGPLVEIAVIVALAVLAVRRGPMRALVGSLIALAYVPLNLSCYFLNAAIQPRVVTAPEFGPMEQTVSAILSMQHRYSLYGSLDILGYALLGLGSLLIMSALWGRSRLWTWATSVWALCTVGCVAGPVGLVIDSDTLTSGTIAGGAISVGSSVLMALAFRQEHRAVPSKSAPADLDLLPA